jgi:hypothetical protein
MSDTGDPTHDDTSPTDERPLDQLTEADTLDDTGVEDPLDRGYSPPDTDRGSRAFGVTAEEQHRDEPLEERIRQEVPDPGSAYGPPDNESGLDTVMVGGDDPDAILAEEDWLGDGEVGRERSGRLVATDEGAHEDEEGELWALDVGIDGAAASAEEAAVHVIDEESETGEA